MKFGSDFVFREDSQATALPRNWFTCPLWSAWERPCPKTSTSEGTTSEMKTTLDGINDRPDIAEEKTSECHDTATELSKMEHGEKRLNEGGEGISELWDKRHRVTGAPKEQGERKTEEMFEEIRIKIFPTVMKIINPGTQGFCSMNPKQKKMS